MLAVPLVAGAAPPVVLALTEFRLGRTCSDNFFQHARLSVPTQNKIETPLAWALKHATSLAQNKPDIYSQIQYTRHPATQFPPLVAAHVCMFLQVC